MVAITPDQIRDHLLGNLTGDLLYGDPDEEVILGVLNENYRTGEVEVHKVDTRPTNILGRFRITVEEVSD